MFLIVKTLQKGSNITMAEQSRENSAPKKVKKPNLTFSPHCSVIISQKATFVNQKQGFWTYWRGFQGKTKPIYGNIWVAFPFFVFFTTPKPIFPPLWTSKIRIWTSLWFPFYIFLSFYCKKDARLLYSVKYGKIFFVFWEKNLFFYA